MQKTWRDRLHKAQSGQAIVLIALIAVALIAALGMAIDGGGLYYLRHEASNATDAAVLAATYAICAGSIDPVQSGLDAAADNGFNNDGVGNTVTVTYPYTSPEISAALSSYHVGVSIFAIKPSYFIQLVYDDPLSVTTNAVGYCKPARMGSAVGAVWSGGVCGSSGNELSFTGSAFTVIGDGHSNGETRFGGTGGGTTVDGDLSSSGGFQFPSGGNFTQTSGTQNPSASQQPDPLGFNVLDFDYNGSIGAPIHAQGKHYRYTGGNVNLGNGDVLEEGLHYFTGNGSVQSNATLRDTNGNGRLEYTFVAQGSLSFNGGSLTNIIYFTHGLLAFSDDNRVCSTAGGLDVTGGGQMMGVLYAPRSQVKLSGSGFNLIGALVGNQVSISAANSTLIEDPTLIPPQPPQVSIAQ